MADRTVAGSLGLKADWDLGEDNWKDDMDANLVKLSVLGQPIVLDTVSATPGAPTEGDIYLFDETHPTQANDIAVYDEGAWVYYTPGEGWEVYDQANDMRMRFDGMVWAEAGGGSASYPAFTGNAGKVLAVNGTEDGVEWIDAALGGGGSGAMSVQDEIYKAVAEANMTMTHGAAGTLFDKVIDKGGFVIFALAGSVRGTTYRAGTSYVVPTGKIAVVVDVKFDLQTLTNPTYYKHRLYNVTTTDVSAGPNGTIVGASATDFIGTYGGNPGPWSAVNVDIPYPTQVGVAGDTLRAEIAGGSDSNDRPSSGIYVVAIIDATTHELEPVT